MPASGRWRPPSTVVPRCCCVRAHPRRQRDLSPVKLATTGGRPYTAHKDFEPLLVGYSIVQARWNSSILAPAISYPSGGMPRRLSSIGTEGSV